MSTNFSTSESAFCVTDANGNCRVKVGSLSKNMQLQTTNNEKRVSKPGQLTPPPSWMAPDDWREPLWTERWSAYFSTELRSIWEGLSDVQKLAFSIAFHEMSDDMHSLAIESAGC
ncbi:hypothetical protein [Citrobacter europaeus]|uniref:hypothetical protein n=1 Tax=Citrobacter europaeus TaxID=1914243 RepID=UPI003EB6B84C